MQGAAALINNSDYLTAAAGILAIEAYHAGSIREQLIQNSSYEVTAYGVEVNQIVGVRTQPFMIWRALGLLVNSKFGY